MAATSSTFHKTRLRRWGIALTVPAILLVAVGVLILSPARRGTVSADDQLIYRVKRGPLTISVTESGTIKALEQEILKSEVEGQTTIIFLVPEGKLVKAGELLVELDASELRDEKVEQEIQLENVRAAFIRAREDLAVAESQAKSDIAQAELDFRFAKEDVSQYIDGEYPKLLMEAKADITLAEEESERATEKLKWSETLFSEKYISQTELDTDRLTKNRAKLVHELAVASLKLLESFTYERTKAQLESNVDQTEMALDRVRRKAKADIEQGTAEHRAKELEFEQQKGKLQKVEDQITKAKIVAPIDGMVIYATTARGSWRGNQEPLDEGEVVREREELIYLPTADAKMAEVKVHESNLDKVELGLRVRVTVDAVPGRVFEGQVATIAPLPDAVSMWLNPDLKVYRTQIHLDGSSEGLRTGMSCRVEIIVERYADVVYVPIQAVLRVGDQPTVYVKKDGQLQARPVKLGLDNNLKVRIVSGLEPGEAVLLKPPLAEATTPPEKSDATQPEPGPRDEGERAQARSRDEGERAQPGARDEGRRPQPGSRNGGQVPRMRRGRK